jgi:hypothetical protein
MQRSYPLRWLALAIGLLATQCLDSISDDCTKTLTCEDDDQPILQPDCVWRYESGREWEGGPQYDTATGKWRWPDGKETDTQTFDCNATDAGGDAGPVGTDCRVGAACDEPLVCNYRTGVCVECLNDTQCSGNMAVGDAGAAIVCDESRQQCVPCLRNEHCTATGDTLVCKVDLTDSTRNECVECQVDSDCGGATPVCDETSNECTTSCTNTAECGGDKPVCNLDKLVCVECLAPTDCKGSDTQCNTTSNQCVECVDDVPCAPASEVCDTTRNRCVQCRDDNQCTTNSTGTHCELQTNLCVQCLDDLQCPSVATSRCNLATHACVGCTADAQCENNLRCNVLLGGGTCVECLGEADCAGNPIEDSCETTSGRCVECLNTAECTSDTLARCQTEAGNSPLTQYSCVGCEENGDCSGKGLPELCDTDRKVCVNCLTNAECSQDPAQSLCLNGNCVLCSDDDDCDAITGLNACLPNVGCVECVDAQDCTGNPGGAVCKTSNIGQASGTAAVNTCVECQSNSDCTNPSAAVCSNNTCVPCTTDNQCPSAIGVCDVGTCVQCTGPKRAACGTNVCNSLMRTCSTFQAGSAAACDTCVSDAQCAADARCVQLNVGASSVYSCFPLATGTPPACAERVFFGVNQSATIDVQQSPPATCVLRRTTCEGYRDYEALSECDQDSDCGATGVADGVCQTGQCSVPCDSSNDCPAVCEAGGFCRL